MSFAGRSTLSRMPLSRLQYPESISAVQRSFVLIFLVPFVPRCLSMQRFPIFIISKDILTSCQRACFQRPTSRQRKLNSLLRGQAEKKFKSKNPPLSPFFKGGVKKIPPLAKGGKGGFAEVNFKKVIPE